MKRRYHIPARLHWQTEPTTEENARLHRAIMAAIRRAIESLTGGAPDIVVTDFNAHEPAHIPELQRWFMQTAREDERAAQGEQDLREPSQSKPA
jgi:hypothetical protein